MSRAQERETKQILSNAEEKTLVRWIKRYTIAGSPLSPELLFELAELIRHDRIRRDSQNEAIVQTTAPIGHEWLYCFFNRFPTMKGIYIRQLELSRYNGASFEVVKAWFDAVASFVNEHHYDSRDIWNMDESGFTVGESQSTRVIVPISYNQKHKVALGKQEWVTDVECISAAGESIAPLLVFKGKDVNSGWIPDQTPNTWHFGTSENGWTSNHFGLYWLIRIFEP